MPKNEERKLTACIDLNNFEQCQWTFWYLSKMGVYSKMEVIHPDNHDWLSYFLGKFKETLIDSPESKLLMKRMKGAWRQRMDRQGRKKRKKNSYSFVIDTECSKQLTALAKRSQQPRNTTLERLIEDAYNGVKSNKLILKEQKQMLKLIEQKARNEEWFNELFNYVSPALLDRAETKIKTLEEENDGLKKQIEKLKPCCNEVEPEDPIHRELKEAFASIEGKRVKLQT